MPPHETIAAKAAALQATYGTYLSADIPNFDKTAMAAAAQANIYSSIGANPCTEIPVSSMIGAYDITLGSPTTTYIGSDYIELAGKRFSAKQLAYLLSKLLEEHPECQL